METRTLVAALCSMITMASLAGVYVHHDAILPLGQAFGVSAGAGLVGAFFGLCSVNTLRWAPGRTAQEASVAKRSSVGSLGALGVSARPGRMLAQTWLPSA